MSVRGEEVSWEELGLEKRWWEDELWCNVQRMLARRSGSVLQTS